ncbi:MULTISPECIES: glycine betaine ABC transporter substrate-binding protein [Mycobacterium ulcerans group]|nr:MULTISPECIES: glycine betaine ABC transporter substrate-binding protein [Mycobacterium ulcerans group]MDC8974016.1 glycine betaine ABC transporter substrate-binding protein [Mycobacterium marinum]MDC9006669.1 glycine betaine ABC transporter substrate-binding protein [Mycobacterium marinum]MDC9016934.1 glycine betaine ABC transporter substrate-binding protein [Mycobacterium marinum]GJO16063.1 putative ABC transporter [Mycobacterium marinum]
MLAAVHRWSKCRRARRLAFAALAVLCVGLVASCGLRSATGAVLEAKPGLIRHYQSLEGVPITVAAKDFTEQLILGNMLSIVLHAAGARVTNLSNTPGSFGVRRALLTGEANIAPEYTGTGWINYLGHENPIKGAKQQWEAVNAADQVNGLTWLPPAPMNNTYTLAIRESEAERLGVTKLSDLKRLPRSALTFCIESEFASRNDGFVPMLHAYGLDLEDLAKITTLDTGVVYSATAQGECNFGEVFTTDGRIPALHLRLLEDDKHFFPLYNLTEVVDTSLINDHPELREIFAQLNPRLTNDTMRELNAQVDNNGRDPAIVAKDWLLQQKLLS